MGILDKINSAADLKKLSYKELSTLADEIREFLIANVSKNGGHLASNLGTVELTIALYRVFNPEEDRIIWDVGHQAYTHKILTGRRDMFADLRKLGGISGFPKISESRSDAFNTGHASTSVSAALGFAAAAKLNGRLQHSVAVIGDGALTGGLAYEGLNNAAGEKLPLVIILNDNGMAISENVGGLSKYLNKIRNDTIYFKFKAGLKRFARLFPFGDVLINFLAHIRDFVKKITLDKGLFENLGLKYYGPIDGHDIRSMQCVFEYIKKSDVPVLVHVKTKKGKGYEQAEESPERFHGVGSFDIETGREFFFRRSESYSTVFGNEITRLAEENDKLVCITAAMPQGTGLNGFKSRFPNRFFDCGIAEEHAVTFASALSLGGCVPVFSVYSTFLQRAYDQILHDTALCNSHVVFAIDHAGAVGADGETHHGIYDLSYLSHIPNMVIMAPSGKTQFEQMLDYAVNKCKAPVAIRYPKGEARDFYPPKLPICEGQSEIVKKGRDVLIISIGTAVKEAIDASELLEDNGISTTVLDMRFLKPFDERAVSVLSSKSAVVATVEDNVTIGGLADAVRRCIDKKILSFGYDDKPLTHGTVSELKELCGLTAENISEKIANEYSSLNID